MIEKFSTFDPAEFLDSKVAVDVFMSDAFETGDAAYIAAALGIVARAQGLAELAAKSGISREQLAISLSTDGNPSFQTIITVLKALGFSLALAPEQAHQTLSVEQD